MKNFKIYTLLILSIFFTYQKIKPSEKEDTITPEYATKIKAEDSSSNSTYVTIDENKTISWNPGESKNIFTDNLKDGYATAIVVALENEKKIFLSHYNRRSQEYSACVTKSIVESLIEKEPYIIENVILCTPGRWFFNNNNPQFQADLNNLNFINEIKDTLSKNVNSEKVISLPYNSTRCKDLNQDFHIHISPSGKISYSVNTKK